MRGPDYDERLRTRNARNLRMLAPDRIKRARTRIHDLSDRQRLIFREISLADRVGFWGNLSQRGSLVRGRLVRSASNDNRRCRQERCLVFVCARGWSVTYSNGQRTIPGMSEREEWMEERGSSIMRGRRRRWW